MSQAEKFPKINKRVSTNRGVEIRPNFCIKSCFCLIVTKISQIFKCSYRLKMHLQKNYSSSETYVFSMIFSSSSHFL